MSTGLGFCLFFLMRNSLYSVFGVFFASSMPSPPSHTLHPNDRCFKICEFLLAVLNDHLRKVSTHPTARWFSLHITGCDTLCIHVLRIYTHKYTCTCFFSRLLLAGPFHTRKEHPKNQKCQTAWTHLMQYSVELGRPSRYHLTKFLRHASFYTTC